MDCQDWNPVIVRGKSVPKTSGTSGPKPSAEAIRLAKLANNEEVKKARVLSKESRLAMMQLRAAQKWTQRDLDMRCSFPANTVRDLEAGKMAPSSGQLSRLNQILKTGLKLEDQA